MGGGGLGNGDGENNLRGGGCKRGRRSNRNYIIDNLESTTGVAWRPGEGKVGTRIRTVIGKVGQLPGVMQ